MPLDHPLTDSPRSAMSTRGPATPPPPRHIAIPTIVEPAAAVPTPATTSTASPSRSPRLGQATFDASVSPNAQEAPPYSARPRLLFTTKDEHAYEGDAFDDKAASSSAGHTWVLGPDELPNPSSAAGDRFSTPQDPAAADGASTTPPVPAIRASFRTLFSLTSRSTLWTVVIPGTAFAIGSGLIPPYMTMILGDSLQAFTDYGLATGTDGISADALKSARSSLLHDVRLQAIKFAILAAVVLAASSANIGLWVIHGERVARELRMHVYRGVTAKGLDWYETGMGGEAEGGQDGATSAVDAAGLTGRFSKDTDDVRIGSAQTVGLVLQYLSSSLFCIILAFYRNWRLAFVVLATIPGVITVVALTERWSGPLANRNRATTADCTSRVNRIISAIPTVKAFNAENSMLMAMFVQGFWYGAHLISSGRSTAASVNTSFWACLLGSSYLQTCIPSLVALEKAKIAMAGLLQLARDDTNQVEMPSPPMVDASTPTRVSKRQRRKDSVAGTISWPIPLEEKIDADHKAQLATSPTLAKRPVPATFIPLSGVQGKRRSGQAPRALRKLRPLTFSGELSLRGVTFHYPARPPPAAPALRDVNLYFAARETTYVVGTSGSGKSTVGALLLGLYGLKSGRVEVDEQGLEWIDEDWLRTHVACVSQGASVLFEGTVHDNVAIGVVGQLQEDGSTRSVQEVSREEVIAACRVALLHDFIRDLPLGYDTSLSGEQGASLSGGQRQRLAIARAYIRNPTVLILDEATSALDATSRVLVHEAVKAWRDNRTTIVITHDLSPIGPGDFVYVMADGRVVQQGYREDLEAIGHGRFYDMLHSQELPEQDEPTEELADADSARRSGAYGGLARSSLALEAGIARRETANRLSTASLLFPPTAEDLVSAGRQLWSSRRASHLSSTVTVDPESSSSGLAEEGKAYLGREYVAHLPSQAGAPDDTGLTWRYSEFSLADLEKAGETAVQVRTGGDRRRLLPPPSSDTSPNPAGGRRTDGDGDGDTTRLPRRTIPQLARRYWRTIPNKLLFAAGMGFSVMVGACTPIFSTFISKVISNLGNPNAMSLITQSAIVVIALAVVDGLGSFLKFYCMERCAMGWTTSLRRKAMAKVVRQDKAFFDMPGNGATALSYSIIKDSEDARTLVGTIICQLAVLASMLVIGIAWSLATGWELTLVGFGMAPIIIVVSRSLASVLNRLEADNKDKREAVSKHLMQVLSHVKAIRSMSIESVFNSTYERAVAATYAGGIRAAPFAGLGFASTFALTYLSQGIMLLVGAVLVVGGRYTFGKMLQVFSLIIFTVTFAGQLMNYLPAMAKSLQAADDLLRLLDLADDTHESRGEAKLPIQGRVGFRNVDFHYPSRPSVNILNGVDFEIEAGECVAIVGASGSGKSTVAALLQRLYEPSAGQVCLDDRALDSIDTHYLRDHTAVVSQHPALFDMTIAENIAYGREDASMVDIRKAAAQAHIDDFIEALPLGYDTKLGDNASFISGGQAQRLQMARALLQPRELLILDECTSALDPTNQRLVLDTVMRIKEGRTTVVITHKLAVMEKCDRLLVMANGRVVETGTVAELRTRPHGTFASLASGGEWEI
ncbi:hypothetical protein JCM10908_004980 [Rhodotorula pacifica]|uniref:uncharacterized protein n=1 Tax=Rhodotorula pacifica TaxID=1495444 RepID=UPI00317C3A97